MLLMGAILYLVFTRWIYQGLRHLKENEKVHFNDLPTVSVVVPARNEDHNIEETLESLAAQDYPAEKYQVVMVNDRSEDQTPGIMTRFTKNYKNFLMVDIESLPPGISPKKNAVEWGIAAANGEIIVTTDADCVHSPRWLKTLIEYFKPEVGLVAGLTIFEPDDESWTHRLHSLDYLSHSFVGAGAVGTGSAMNCTASNLAYRYQAFMELEGFGDKAEMVSGDDEFFLQRLVKNKRWKAVFALGEDSVVKSLPPETLKGIIDQRHRWGSKGLFYPAQVKRTAIGIFLYFLLLVLSPVFVLTDLMPLSVFIIGLMVKVLSDLRVTRKGCSLFDLRFPAATFMILSALHPPLIIITAAIGHIFPFKWKGDPYRSKVSMSNARRI